MLGPGRLRGLLGSFPALRIGVVGDFFLDAYYDCHRALEERSLETGRACRQVVRLRRQAGAAGTVAANLVALGVGCVEAVGFCGDDGEGYELRRAMRRLGLDLQGFLTVPERFTPTYGKPCHVERHGAGWGVVEELERLDTKNRRPTPAAVQEAVIACVEARMGAWDGLILMDQVSESGCGVLTGRVRRRLLELARQDPHRPVLGDSRERIHLFRHVLVKPNRAEAARALGGQRPARTPTAAGRHALALARCTGRPVFLTLGEQGILVADRGALDHVPGVPVTGPVDPVGAGDSASAAIVAAMAAGAAPAEAAGLACLVASITVQQIGTTGTATPAQVLRRHREVSRAS
ncbi:MAG: PfkB family carbohydrate kinase [Candidatus Latescibacterota bacterium]